MSPQGRHGGTVWVSFDGGATWLLKRLVEKGPFAMQSDMPAALELEQRLRRFMDESIRPFITEQGFCNAARDRFMAVLGDWAESAIGCAGPIARFRGGKRNESRAAEALIPEFMDPASP